MSPSRACLDARLVGYPGIGRFVLGLWKGLIRIGADFVPICNPDANEGYGGAVSPLPGPARTVRIEPFWPTEQALLPLYLRRWNVGVFHSPHLTVPYASRVPVVLTVHDVFPLRDASNARSRASAAYYRVALPAAVRKATFVVAVSNYARDEAKEMLQVPDEKLVVIEHGVDVSHWYPRSQETIDADLRALGVARPYLLYVGTAKRHKNVRVLLDAVCRAPDLPRLVIAGSTPREVLAATPSINPGERVQFLGRVADDLLPSLYGGAVALGLPSLYEAVGFTALESMACGTPVVASSGGGLPDTVGDAGLLVLPDNVDGWIDSFRTLASDSTLRTNLVAKGRSRVSSRDWSLAAAAYERVYRGAADSR